MAKKPAPKLPKMPKPRTPGPNEARGIANELDSSAPLTDQPPNGKRSTNRRKTLIKKTPKENWLPAERLWSRVTQDVSRLSDQCNRSDVRTILNSLHRYISPHFAEDGETHFPCQVNRHAAHPTMCAKGKFGDVLLFYVCDAVLGYYAFVRGEGTQQNYDAIDKLRYIASEGIEGFDVRGGEEHGFALSLKYRKGRDDQLL